MSGKSARPDGKGGSTEERAPREPVIPQAPQFTEGDTTFAVLSGRVATVTAKRKARVAEA